MGEDVATGEADAIAVGEEIAVGDELAVGEASPVGAEALAVVVGAGGEPSVADGPGGAQAAVASTRQSARTERRCGTPTTGRA